MESLGADSSPAVRAAVAVALDARDVDGEATTRIARLLADREPVIREAVLNALAATDTVPHLDALAPVLIDALDDDRPGVRRMAASLLGRCTGVPAGLLDVLASGTSRAQDAALLALLGHGPAVRDEVIAWAEAQIAPGRRTSRASRLAVAGDQDAVTRRPDTAAAFLASVLERREGRLADRALGALAVLGAPEARGVIRRCLRSDDQETRAQAMEALDSIGDRRLGGAVVRFLDADAGSGPLWRDTVLAGWRMMTTHGSVRWRAEPSRTHGGTVPMPDTARTIGEIDTMLTLRRVPLFEELDPEDLQRIAATTVERVYPSRARRSCARARSAMSSWSSSRARSGSSAPSPMAASG